MKKIILALIFISAVSLYAAEQTFIREYTYNAGEADSKITSRAIALDQVKKLLLEEIGVYIQSEFKITEREENNIYSELTENQIQSITAGITETKILDEKWNGETYYIKASITVDPEEVINNINRIANDKNKLKELEEVKKRADEAYAEIERLRRELALSKNENEKLIIQKKYSSASDVLSASDWVQKGYDAGERKEFDNAILFYGNAIALNPDYAVAYYNLGVVYVFKGDYDTAIKNFKKAIELNPDYAIAYNNLGVIYEDKGDFDTAIKNYKKAIELNSNNALTYYNLGNVYNYKNDFDSAIKNFEKAIELNPDYAKAYNNLGITYHNKGDYDTAIKNFEKAIELNPDYTNAYNNLGNAYYGKGDIDKQIQNYQKAARLGDINCQEWLKNNGYDW